MNNDDHFVPQFYLRRWADKGKLSVARYIEQKEEIVWSELSPKGTGYEEGLYKELEEKFFKPLDDKGAKTTEWFEENKTDYFNKLDMGAEKHLNWAKYILAQLVRIPEVFKEMTTKYVNMGITETDSRIIATKVIENENAIRDLRALTWVFANVGCNHELVTCDNPLIFKPRDLLHPKCVIILPMGPKSFFMATNKNNLSNLTTNQSEMVSSINQEIIKNAKERIYAKSKHSISESFLVKHWNKT